MTLEPGDLILTGTPGINSYCMYVMCNNSCVEGVGPILPGQIVEAGLTNIIEMKFPVKEREVSNN
jgi:2-keto-4-pentenoate hydratase/2-oxohepta-3-ene-1,7-dioic acid hydratase in catechol pathway